MRASHLYNTGSIRFRRWSRAGYAVFASLGSNVTIGRLVVSISDKSLQKSFATTVNSDISLKSDGEIADNETEFSELEAILNINQSDILSEISYDNAAACSHNSSYLYIHHSG